MWRKSVAAMIAFPVIILGQGASFPPRGGGGGGSPVPGTAGQVPVSNGAGGFGTSVTPSRCLTTDCGNTANFSGPPIPQSLVPTTAGAASVRSVTAPTASVTATCSGTCATTWTYEPVGISGPSGSQASPGTTYSTSNATSLDATHYNRITVTCADSLVTGVSVYRTVPTGSKGLLGQVVCGGYIDDLGQGLAGQDPPASNNSGAVDFSAASSVKLPITGSTQCVHVSTTGVVSGTGSDCGSGGGGMTNPMTTLGDIITGGSGGTAGRLGVGSSNQALVVTSGAPAWASVANSVAGRTGAVTLTSTDVGLANVTNNAQTQAAVVPNTAPSAGQILVGNAGGTAYAPVSMGADCSMASTGAITCTKTNNVSFGSAATMNLSNVTNDVQTKAAVVPNTAPTSGQLLVGNAGGTAYAPVSMSGDCTTTSTGAITCTKTNGSAFGTGATATIANYAPLAGPTFTGVPAAPTAAADTNTTQLATTAFVVGQAASTNPVIDGTAAPGTSLKYARGDHVHPTDTSRVATSTTVNAQALSGNISVNNGAAQYSVAVNGAAGAAIQGIACGAGTTIQGAASANPTCTATPTLGVAGTTVGSVALANATSGTITLSPTTGALATTTITLPANTGTAVVAATSTTTTQAMFATATAGAPAFRAIAAGDLPGTLTSGTAITNASLTTPSLGVATATSVNKVAITAPATSATLTIANGKTLTANNSITLTGTDSTTMTFPSASSTIPGVIASGTAALGTSAISSAACATVVTVSATGTATTDVIQFTPNADITAVTGYAPSTSGGLSIYPYPTANNVNFKVCNWSGSSITPGAVTLNWRVSR